jgi:hypothetical protein
MSEPLQRTFIADPPMDLSVQLINILQRQCEVDEQTKKAVIEACQYIVNKYKPVEGSNK